MASRRDRALKQQYQQQQQTRVIIIIIIGSDDDDGDDIPGVSVKREFRFLFVFFFVAVLKFYNTSNNSKLVSYHTKHERRVVDVNVKTF